MIENYGSDPSQVPPDFPEMVDTFQYPVAYQNPNERRIEQDNQVITPNVPT
jgi:hypothetical protein